MTKVEMYMQTLAILTILSFMIFMAIMLTTTTDNSKIVNGSPLVIKDLIYKCKEFR